MVRVSKLHPEATGATYYRRSHDRYEYTAQGVGYADVLEVDDGAIAHYPQLWEQER